eukprot:290175-Ditylum_brightwellii.AAC.1
MEEINRHSQMSEENPAIQSLLVDHIGYIGTTDYTDKVLKYTATMLPDVNPCTEVYLDQFYSLNGALITQAESMLFE